MRQHIRSTWSAIIFCGLALAGLPACDDYEVACTLIGCIDPLHVRFETVPEGPTQVVLLVDGAVQEEMSCTGATNCANGVFFRSAPTARVSIRVTNSAGTRVTEFPTISYTHSRVNGPNCPPDCLNATITAKLPA
ncbi:MAG: hypothetical protein ACO1Q7_07100 [Gemmatimonas sp.]